jgi:voltage-gated potassium channel
VHAGTRRGERGAVTRRRTWEVLEGVVPGDRAHRRFAALLVALIGANVVAVILQSVPALDARFGAAFLAFEAGSLVLFAAEYVARLWACVEDERYRRPVAGRLRFALRPMSVLDLLAVLSLVVPFESGDARVLLAGRLFRLGRVARATRYSRALQLFARVVRSRREELVVSGLLMLALLLIASTTIYFAEHAAQPYAFPNIPQSAWWAVVTLTTVGYGDVVPVTPVGRFAAGAIAVLGVAFFALPTAILASGFMHAVHDAGSPPRCPHCGEPLEP